MKKRLPVLLALVLLCLIFTGCSRSPVAEGGIEDHPLAPAVTEINTTGDQTWAIYWYLCGSDLESWYGCANADLEEMMAVTLPENVQVIIQTGGATAWMREDISPDGIGRYLYDKNGFRLLEEQPQSNMGETETLASFLKFCTSSYPADRTMVLFWNHGGGSVNGAAFDANYYFDSLTIDEFRAAFEQTCELNSDNPPFDIVGFDACLMATIDVAGAFKDIGRYLVASEELEPGNGWYYTGWLQALAEKAEMDAEQLGIAICDAYAEGCELAGTAGEITLSVTDLSKIDRLLEAYDQLGTAVLLGVAEDPGLFVSYSRGAMNAENYGGNTEEEGYTNMVDLGHLTRNNTLLLPDSAVEVQKALEDCIVYKVSGPYRSEAGGLSCFHSYNSDMENFVEYTSVGCSEAFKYLYGYGISGKISSAGLEYIRSAGGTGIQPPEDTGFDISTLENAEIWVDDYGNAELYVGAAAAKSIVSVQFILATFNEESMVNLGWSDTAGADFEEGLFADVVDGYWPSIDGYPVHTEVVYQGEDYTIYSIPVLLNGEQCNLRVVYDDRRQDYTVLGARKGLSDDGMADKNLIQLRSGDEITILYQERALLGSGGFGYRTGAVLTVTEETMFYETPLPPGDYGMMFKIFDARGKSVFSEVLHFTMDEEYIYFY